MLTNPNYTLIVTRRVWRYQGEIRIRISKKNRQHNGQMKKYKRTNNDPQNIDIKLRSSNTNPTNNRGELMCSGKVGSSCSISGTRHDNLFTNPVISHEWGKDR